MASYYLPMKTFDAPYQHHVTHHGDHDRIVEQTSP